MCMWCDQCVVCTVHNLVEMRLLDEEEKEENPIFDFRMKCPQVASLILVVTQTSSPSTLLHTQSIRSRISINETSDSQF